MGATLEAAHSFGRALSRRRRLPDQPSVEEEDGVGLRILLYDAHRTDRTAQLDEVGVHRLTNEQLLWIDVSDAAELDRVAASLGLTADTLEELAGVVVEPTLFLHAGYIHLTVVATRDGALTPHGSPLHVLVGPNWVVTVHRDPIAFLDRYHEQIRADSTLGRIDSYEFLAAMLQEHVASFLAELRPLELELERVDVRSMAGKMNEEALLRELVGTRVRLTRLRRLLEPHRAIYARLATSEFAVLTGSEAETQFEALGEFLERAIRSMDSTREMIKGSFEIYTTWAAHGTNQLMKRLTIASVTLLPPTLLAGVMGMNSLPARLTTPTAFWISAAVMCSVVGITLVTAWRRSWI